MHNHQEKENLHNIQTENKPASSSPSLPKYKVACIGAGKMLTALIGGMLKQGYDPQHIMATRRDNTALQNLATDFGIQVSDNNRDAASWADIIILGVKPAQFTPILSSLAEVCRGKLIISVMAGVSTAQLKSSLTGDDWSVVRAMPNLPCQSAQGVTGLFAAHGVSAEQRQWTEQLFTTLGVVLWLQDEAKMHALTVISGSGPAYFLLLQEYLIAFARQEGFSEQEAETLVHHTARGAAAMLMQSDYSAQKLRSMISSPGGVTEKIIRSVEQDQLQEIWQRAWLAGCLHSEGMAH